jgi:hypothetical protein
VNQWIIGEMENRQRLRSASGKNKQSCLIAKQLVNAIATNHESGSVGPVGQKPKLTEKEGNFQPRLIQMLMPCLR